MSSRLRIVKQNRIKELTRVAKENEAMEKASKKKAKKKKAKKKKASKKK